MTCAGIASTMICKGRVSQGIARINGNTIRVLWQRSRRRGSDRARLQWLGRRFSVNTHPGAAEFVFVILLPVCAWSASGG